MQIEDFESAARLGLESATVAVVGRDPVVGRALVLLLKNTDYEVVWLPDASLNDSKALDGIHLLLLAPGFNAVRREALKALIESQPAIKSVPILELATGSARSGLHEQHFTLPWPCRVEDLQRQIDANLECIAKPHER